MGNLIHFDPYIGKNVSDLITLNTVLTPTIMNNLTVLSLTKKRSINVIIIVTTELINKYNEEILTLFEQTYEQYMEKGFSNIKETWENYGFRMNEKLKYTSGKIEKEALFLGIAEDGALLVQHDNGQVEKVYSAEIAWF